MILTFKKILRFLWPFAIGIIIGIVAIWFYINKFNVQTSFLSPLGLDPQVSATKIPSQKPVIGFLPYWNLKTAQIPYYLLDYIAYFSITLDYDGSIQTFTDQGVDVGWYKLESSELAQIFDEAHKQDVKTMLVFTCFNNENIDTIITNPDSKKAAIENIVSTAQKYQINAVNIDFEYNTAYDILENSSTKYAQFLKELREQLPNTELSIDLYANAFIKTTPYNIADLAPQVDQLVLMGYDFHQASSPKAGPVAPIKNPEGKSISEALQGVLDKQVDTNKVILAMPFYGYEWQTTSDEYRSPTYPGSGAMASYKRVQELIADEGLETQWDPQTLSPWLTYEDDGITKQIYFENDQSIALKLQLVDQMNLAGAAIWALGYEGEDASVWQVVESWRISNQRN
ncbi:hypothetical protein GYA49_05785 [Candidatus Beckwithbacteria bacterium]|nr:hypothetical protein [Candidatus Beckwithbacteria bacterium]